MKKICFFHPSSDLYGSDKIFLNCVSTFTDCNITVVLRVDGPLIEMLRKIENINIVIEPCMPILAKKNLNLRGVLNLLYNLYFFRKACRKYNLYESDVIYLNTIATAPILSYFNSKHKRIVHLHETIDTSIYFYQVIVKYITQRADYIICVSRAVLNPLQRLIPSRVSKLKQVYNGIKPHISDSTIEIKGLSDPNKIKMALIGRIKPVMKGQNMLVDAVSLLSQEDRAKSIFFIVGSPVLGQEYMLDNLRQYIKDKEVDDNIFIVPFVENIFALYPQLDVILTPSLCEDSLPTTVLEAMYFSKPVIGTVSGGIPEMIQDNVNGLLVEKHNVEQLREAISLLINNNTKIKQMGKVGKSIFEEKFTQSRFEENYKSLLEEIL